MPPTLADVLQRVTQRQNLDGLRSVAGVERNVKNHLVPVLGSRAIVSLTTADVEAFAGRLKADGYAAATINLILHPLRAAFRLYADEHETYRAPKVPFLRVRNTREGFIERTEFERIVAELPMALRPPFWFTYFTGWRTSSEVLHLRWDVNVKLDDGLIVLPAMNTKADQSTRVFPFAMLPELDALLRAQRAQTPAAVPWVFHRFRGKRIQHVRHAWHSAVHRALCGCGDDAHAKVHRYVPHDFRRTAARNMRRAGVPDNLIMALVGWTTTAMLHRYLGRASETDLRDAVTKLARLSR